MIYSWLEVHNEAERRAQEAYNSLVNTKCGQPIDGFEMFISMMRAYEERKHVLLEEVYNRKMLEEEEAAATAAEATRKRNFKKWINKAQ